MPRFVTTKKNLDLTCYTNNTKGILNKIRPTTALYAGAIWNSVWMCFYEEIM